MGNKLDKEVQLLQALTAAGVKITPNEEIAKEPIVIVGMPDDGVPIRLVPGSKNTHKCVKCGVKVWLAPSGMEVLALNEGNTVWCVRCVQKKGMQ